MSMHSGPAGPLSSRGGRGQWAPEPGRLAAGESLCRGGFAGPSPRQCALEPTRISSNGGLIDQGFSLCIVASSVVRCRATTASLTGVADGRTSTVVLHRLTTILYPLQSICIAAR